MGTVAQPSVDHCVRWPGVASPFRMVSAKGIPVVRRLELWENSISERVCCQMLEGGQSERRAAANRVLQSQREGHCSPPQTSEALMALRGQKYLTGRGRGNRRKRWWRQCHGVCVSCIGADAVHQLTPCGSPFGLDLLACLDPVNVSRVP